jgi:lysozyme
MKTVTPIALALCFLSLAAMGCTAPTDDEVSETGSTSDALQQCAETTVEGVDVSAHNGTIDWPAVKAAGVGFAVMKATQGTTHINSTFAQNWAEAKAAGVVPSAYHFFDPTKDGVEQARHFLSVMGPLRPGDLAPTLDIECPDGNAECLGFAGGSGNAPAGVIRQRMLDWLRTVEEATGMKPWIYTFNTYFTGSSIDTTGLEAYPLFIASLSTTSCFRTPSPWTKALMWQYSWKGRVAGITGEVDLDRFIGRMSDLQALTKRESSVVASAIE